MPEVAIEGTVAHGYERVRDAFAENFTSRGELGGAVCVYRDGEKVVDLWGGHELGLRPETLAALEAPATASRRGFYDELFRASAKFSLGFMKPNDSVRFGHDDRAYGAPGTGGSVGFADPTLGIGYGYVTSRMGLHLEGDPRDLALRAAIP